MITSKLFTLTPFLHALAASLIALAGTTATPVHGDAVKIFPVDEAAQDPNFLAFRNNLLAAVSRRDVDAVVAAAVEDIKLSFGGGYGRTQFRQQLTADDNGDGGSYWEEMEWALKLGGVFDDAHGRQFCTPYISCSGPHQCAACDPFETLVAVSSRAPVYAAADATAPVIARLSYEVVTLVEYGSPWRLVRLGDGRTGTSPFPTFARQSATGPISRNGRDAGK